MSAMSPSFSLPEGGIFRLPDCITAFIKRLSEGLPGTTAGPRVPPLIRFSRLSIRSPPIPAAVEWQAWHWRANKGRILVSKNAGPSSWASATAGIATRQAKATAAEERVFHMRLGRFYHCLNG